MAGRAIFFLETKGQGLARLASVGARRRALPPLVALVVGVMVGVAVIKDDMVDEEGHDASRAEDQHDGLGREAAPSAPGR